MTSKNTLKNNTGQLSEKRIAVVGLGYVGLPLALLANRKGYNVLGIDRDKTKIEKINKRVAPYEDKNISDFLKTSNIKATTKWEEIKNVSTIIVCVPTPIDHHNKPDLGPVKDASMEIGKRLKAGQMVILESTVNPGVCEEIIIPILEKRSKMKVGKDFYLSHCPERINPGDTKWNVENIPRVIGSVEEEGLKRGVNFYKSILSADVKPMKSLKEAESVKIVENSFRDINIAFVNELAQSFSNLGIDVVHVIEGASTKPFAFLAHYPGCGVGGHCIPVDPYYLIEYAKKNGFKHRFLELARKINNHMPKFTVDLVQKMLTINNEKIKGSKITVLGLAYKADIDDYRESPSFKIIKHLKKLGAKVVVYDPYVKSLSTAKNIEDAVKNAKAVVIATAHKQFKELSPQFFLKQNVGVVIDGQNCLKEDAFVEAGIMYEGIGKNHNYENNKLPLAVT